MEKKIEDIKKELERKGFKSDEQVYWNYKEAGDYIVGIYDGFEQGELSKIHKIKTENGETVRFFGATVLDKKLEGKEGKNIAIIYAGRKKNDKNIEYHDFEILIRPNLNEQ